MRRAVALLAAVLVGVLGAGVASAIAASSLTQEETIVLGEHTLKGRNLDLAGEPDDFAPGDRYVFRSRLTAADAVAGHLYVDCSVHFGRRDVCSQVYDMRGRGTIVAEGLIPVAEVTVGGSWTLAVTGGTGEFANVHGWVDVTIVDETGDSEHTLVLMP